MQDRFMRDIISLEESLLQRRSAFEQRDAAQWREEATPMQTPHALAAEFARDPTTFLQGKSYATLTRVQEDMIAHILRREATPFHGSCGAMLCSPAGVGKTLGFLEACRRSAVAAVAAALAEGTSTPAAGRFGHPTLVVVQLTILQQWIDEGRRWFNPAHLAITAIASSEQELTSMRGGQGSRRKDRHHTIVTTTSAALDADARYIAANFDIVITTYDTLVRAVQPEARAHAQATGRGLAAIPFGRIAVDEGAIMISNQATERWRACTESFPTPFRVFISATPLQNYRLEEVNAVVAFLGCSLRIPRIAAAPAPLMHEDEARDEEEEESSVPEDALEDWERIVLDTDTRRRVQQLLGELMLADGLLEMRLPDPVWLEFPPQERLQYDLVAAETHLPEMTRRNRLRRLCVSPDLLSHKHDAPAQVTERAIPSHKIAYMLNYLERNVQPGEKVIIFHEWKSVLDYVAAWLRLRRISYAMMVGPTPVHERRSIIERVRSVAEHPRVVLMTLKLGAHGLDGLQGCTPPDAEEPIGGANHVLFISGYWTPTTEYQAISRLTRPGQGREVHARKFAFVNSVEVEMHVINAKKVTAGQAIMAQLSQGERRA